MKQAKIRYAQPEDAAQIAEWLSSNPANSYDREILKYPTLRVVCSYDDAGPICFVPMHKVMMFESIAKNPGASPLMSAQALRDATKAAELICSGEGIREIYFLGGAEGVGQMAAGNGLHGFEELPFKVYRMRL